MIERGKMQMRLIVEGAQSIEDMFHCVSTPGYFVALTADEFATLRSLDGDMAKVDHLYENGGEKWVGADLCELEDAWAAIHLILNRAPLPEDADFPWNYGEEPLVYAIRGTESLIDADGALENGYAYMIHVVDVEWVPKIAAALPEVTPHEFLALYDQFRPRHWLQFGPRDAAICYLMFERLKAFYKAHATNGKTLVLFGEL